MKPLMLPTKTKFHGQNSASNIFLNKLLRKKRNRLSKGTVVRKYGRFAITILILSIVSGLLFYAYNYAEKRGLLNINKIEISGASNYVNYDDLEKISGSNLIGKKYFSVDLNAVSKVLQENFLGAKHITLERGSIGEVKILVEERIPLAILFAKPNNKSYLIDSDGYVLGEVEGNASGLPVVNYSKSVVIGSFVEKDVAPITIEILKLSEKNDLRVSSISYYPKYTSLFVFNGVEVRIANDKNRENSISLISSLLKRTGNDGKKISKIDLRFDKVIVSYE